MKRAGRQAESMAAWGARFDNARRALAFVRRELAAKLDKEAARFYIFGA